MFFGVNQSSAPLFRASFVGNRVEVHGVPRADLGHKIDTSRDSESDGIFVEWSWDGQSLTIRNDRYGFYPVFYCVHDGNIGISTSIRRLIEAGAPADLNGPGLAVFLRIGFFVGDDTPFRYIQALPPNSVMVWRDGKLAVSSSRIETRESNLTRSQIVDGFISLFEKAIRRRLPLHNEFAIPLSGGRDSRHVLFELLKAGYRPKFCITSAFFPETPSDDIDIASRLAKHFGLEHVIMRQRKWCEAEARKNEITNCLADEHAWIIAMADYLKAKTAVLYDGIGGDVLSAGLFLDPDRLECFLSGDYDRFASSLLGPESFGRYNVREPVLKELVGTDWYKQVSFDVAKEHLSKEASRHGAAPNPIGSFFFWNRTRREIALSPFSILGADKTVYCPYLDHELYDFLASIPARELLDHKLHDEVIRFAYREYADIPFENKNGGLVDRRRILISRNRELLRYFMLHRQKKVNVLRRSYLLPRLCYGVMANSHRAWWPDPALVLYLSQLESFIGSSMN